MIPNTPRNFGVKARLAQDLTNFTGSPKEFRGLLADREKTGDYHRLYTPADIRVVRQKLLKIPEAASSGVPPVVVVHMTKGGVGKTTLAVNVAVALATYGYRTCFIDGDPQGTASEMFGLDTGADDLRHIGHLIEPPAASSPSPDTAICAIYPDHMLDLIPADVTLARANLTLVSRSFREKAFRSYLDAHKKAFSRYDVIIVDTAPSTSPLNTALLYAGTGTVLAPLVLDGQSIKAVQVLADVLAEVNSDSKERPLRPLIVPNAFRSTGLTQMALKRLMADYRDYLGSTVIPHSPTFLRQFDLEDEGMGNRPALEREPSTTAARAVRDLAVDLIQSFDIRLGGQRDPRFLATKEAA